jgi:Glycosyltransferase family 87
MARHWLRLAVGTWLVLAVVIAVRTLISPGTHTVFPIFAASATHWWANRSLYSWNPPLDLFRYPPIFAVAVTPFGALGLRAGGILWSWVGMAVYAIGLWRFARDVLPPGWTRERAAAFLALGAVVALPGLWNAQSNTLVVGLLLLAASGTVRRCWWTAAFLLAAATWIKVTPVVPALLLCALWPRRLAPRLAAALAVGALLPFLTRPPDMVLDRYIEWIVAMTRSSEARWPGFRDGWTAWVVARHFFQGNPGPLPLRQPIDWAGYPALQLGAAACTLAWCLWQRQCQTEPRRVLRLTLAMGMAWLMLFGPAVEHPTYAFLAPFLAWALLEGPTWPGGRWPSIIAFLLIAVFGWQPLIHPLLGRLPLLLAALPAGTALFAAWLIGYARVSASQGNSFLRPMCDRPFPTWEESAAFPIEPAN